MYEFDRESTSRKLEFLEYDLKPLVDDRVPGVHELGGAAAHLVQHVEPTLPAEGVIAISLEHSLRLAGDDEATCLALARDLVPPPGAASIFQRYQSPS